MTNVKKIIRNGGSVLAIVAILLLIIRSQGESWQGRARVRVGGAVIKAEVADSAEARTRGLSSRPNLRKGQGLLLVFDQPGRYAIWMKDMNFPLDIMWIKDGRLADFVENAPPPAPGTPDSELYVYEPYILSDYILEVGSGFIESRGLKIGDPVEVIR